MNPSLRSILGKMDKPTGLFICHYFAYGTREREEIYSSLYAILNSSDAFFNMIEI